MINAATRGTLNTKTPKGSMELFEEMAMNSYQWYNSRVKPNKTAHVYNIDMVTTLAVQVESLNKKITGLMVTKQMLNSHCDLCGGIHGSQECQAVKNMEVPSEHVDYMRNAPKPQNNPYSNTYNLG